jgi:hypothetical protein
MTACNVDYFEAGDAPASSRPVPSLTGRTHLSQQDWRGRKHSDLTVIFAADHVGSHMLDLDVERADEKGRRLAVSHDVAC